jgi:hypothetical protein
MVYGLTKFLEWKKRKLRFYTYNITQFQSGRTINIKMSVPSSQKSFIQNKSL